MLKLNCGIVGLSICILAVSAYVAVLLTIKSQDETFEYIDAPIAQATDSTEASRKLVEYTKNEFLKKEVLTVGDNIHVAIGWALANSIMIEGEDGIIIVDTTENPDSMKEIMAEFRKITNKPVRAIIFTHFHTDHVGGAASIIAEEKIAFPNNTVDLYSHELTKDLAIGFSETYDIAFVRSVRQLGLLLQQDPTLEMTGAGIGPIMRLRGSSVLDDCVTFSDYASYTIAGVKIDLIHTPGETDDQCAVWLPDKRAILPGDNFYRTFPNLYAIRGSPARNSKQWCASLDRIRSLGGKYLIGSHTQPIQGEEAVDEALRVYRAGIKYIHDQTVRLFNKGYFPGEIVEELNLPDKLARHPYLQEHYGSVPWSVKGVFTNYLGWFSGDPRDLHPMSESDRADRMARLVSYAQTSKDNPVDVLLQHAQLSHQNSYKHYQETGKHILSDDKWALELVDNVLQIAKFNSLNQYLNEKTTKRARAIKVSALRAIGVEEVSANGRNYYLTYAMETESGVKLQRRYEGRAYVINTSPIERVLGLLCAKVAGLKCQDKDYVIAFSFTDTGEEYVITLRDSVCDVWNPFRSNTQPTVNLSTTTEVFKSLSADDRVGSRVPDLENQIGLNTVQISSGTVDIYREFLECFDPMNSA